MDKEKSAEHSTEQKAQPRKRGSKSASVTANLKAEPSDISRIIHQSFQYFDRKPPKDNDELAERLNGYFVECEKQGRIPTVENMALALGVTRSTIWDWENLRSGNAARSYMIKKAKEIMADIDAALVQEGKIPQVTYIFRAKNFYGMKDQQEVVLTPNASPLGDQKDAESLQKKYLEKTYGSEMIEKQEDADQVTVTVPAKRKKTAPEE